VLIRLHTVIIVCCGCVSYRYEASKSLESSSLQYRMGSAVVMLGYIKNSIYRFDIEIESYRIGRLNIDFFGYIVTTIFCSSVSILYS